MNIVLLRGFKIALMKYYIYKNKQLKKVKRYEYEEWISQEQMFLTLPDYRLMIDEKLYSIETVYAGAVDDEEDALPFVLCRIESELELRTDGVGFKTTSDVVLYFANYEALHKRYTEL